MLTASASGMPRQRAVGEDARDAAARAAAAPMVTHRMRDDAPARAPVARASAMRVGRRAGRRRAPTRQRESSAEQDRHEHRRCRRARRCATGRRCGRPADPARRVQRTSGSAVAAARAAGRGQQRRDGRSGTPLHSRRRGAAGVLSGCGFSARRFGTGASSNRARLGATSLRSCPLIERT